MKSTVTDRKTSQVTLEVEIDSKTVDQKLDEIYQQNVQELDIPGFRKGKIPKSFLKAKFGEDLFYEEAQEQLVEEYLPEALEEHQVDAVSEPEVEVVEFDRGEDFIFEATAEILPEVSIPDYEEIKVEDLETEGVTEEEMEDRLDQLREDNAQAIPKEEPVVEAGDSVQLENPSGEGTQVTVDEDSPTLSQLIGHEAGDEVSLNVQTEEGEQSVEYTIQSVKKIELPELDDEFARDLGYEDLDALRGKVKTDLTSEKESQREKELENKVLDKIVELSGVQAPENMVEEITEDRLGNIKDQLGSGSFESFLEQENRTEEELREDLRDSARSEVQKQLVLDTIAEEEEITVDDDELDERIEEEAEERDVNPIKFKNQLKAEEQFDSFRESVKREKVMDFLMDKVTLIEEESNE